MSQNFASSLTVAAETMQPPRALQEIDDDIKALQSCSWAATLPFPVYYCHPSECLPSDACSYAVSDLFENTSTIGGLVGGMIARFNPATFPVIPGGMDKNKSVWNKLYSDLMGESKKLGKCILVTNGYRGKRKNQIAIHCNRYKTYNENSKRPRAGGKLRARSINRDKHNVRKDNGKAQMRRTSTSKPVAGTDDITCKAKLVIGIDLLSFFVVCGVGNNVHTGHLPLHSDEMPTKKQMVPEKAVAVAKQMANRGARPGVISGVLKDQFDVDLTRRQIAQSTEMAKLATDLIGTEHLEEYKHCMSDTDRVFEHLENIGASFVALYHQTGDCDPERPRQKKQKTNDKAASLSNSGNDRLIIESVSSDGNTKVTKVSDTGENEQNEDVMKYAVNTREVVGAAINQTVLVALVWTTPQGKRYFQAFPEQLSIDGTHKTTKDKWELITFSVQDMNGGQETVIRCWAPNNRSWLYRWLFQVACPLLVGRPACKETKLAISDGDPQECKELDSAALVVFVNAKRRRCGWHVVDRGWISRIGQSLGGKSNRNRKAIDRLVREIKNWMYSWMRDVETIEEYKVSKALLLSFLQSNAVTSILEPYHINEVVVFLRNHVFPVEDLYARCHYLGIGAMDAYSNTPHEGTNSASKYCENRVAPSMSQAESTKKLMEQDESRAKTKQRQVADSFHKTQLHSSDKSSQHLQKEADSHLKQEMGAANRYISIRVSPTTWRVLCGVNRTEGNHAYPTYERVRTVTIDDKQQMKCSCGRTADFGFPDRHMAHVAIEYGLENNHEVAPFSHHDVAMRHHNSYCQLVAMKEPSELTDKEHRLRSKLLEVRRQKLDAPRMKSVRDYDDCAKFAVGSLCDSTIYSTYNMIRDRIMEVKEKRVSALNYTDSDINIALKRVNGGMEHAAGFSQSLYNCIDDDDNDAINFGWDESHNSTSSIQRSSYAEAMPRANEFVKAMESVHPDVRKWAIGHMDDFLKDIDMKQREKERFTAPVGNVVSGKPNGVATKPKKQDYFRSSGGY